MQRNGKERLAAIETDIAWLKEQFNAVMQARDEILKVKGGLAVGWKILTLGLSSGFFSGVVVYFLSHLKP